jgi:hypothetical protein
MLTPLALCLARCVVVDCASACAVFSRRGLVCLTGSKELDGGRSLIREHTTSVMAAAE